MKSEILGGKALAEKTNPKKTDPKKTLTLRFSGLNMDNATNKQLLRELRDATKYINTLTKIIESRLG